MQDTQILPKDITDSQTIKHVNLKTIAVSEQTYGSLTQLGKMHESFDSLILRLVTEIGDNRRNNVAESGSELEPRTRLATKDIDINQGVVHDNAR